MRIWMIADTHFGFKNDDEKWLNEFTNYFYNIVFPLLKENAEEEDILVHLGDIFDNRKFVGLKTLATVQKLFEDLTNIISDVRIVIGNHDIFNKNSNSITSVDILKNINGITIYKEADCCLIDGKQCLFLPWVNDVETEIELLKKYKNIEYIFCHSEINGADMGSGQKSNTNIKISDFNCKHVYSGHIHIRSNSGKVHYIGAPYHLTRTDINHEKGITCLDVKTGETEFYENTFSPRFMKINANDIDIKNFDTEILKNNYVDVYVKQSEAQDIDVVNVMKFVSDYTKASTLKIDDDITVETVVITECDKNKTIGNHIDDYTKILLKSYDCKKETEDEILRYISSLKSKFSE